MIVFALVTHSLCSGRSRARACLVFGEVRVGRDDALPEAGPGQVLQRDDLLLGRTGVVEEGHAPVLGVGRGAGEELVRRARECPASYPSPRYEASECLTFSACSHLCGGR